jgi:hypothetical protein
MVGKINQNIVYFRFLFYKEDPSESGDVVGNNNEVLKSLKADREIVGIAQRLTSAAYIDVQELATAVRSSH